MMYPKFLRWAVLGLISIIFLVPFIVADGSFWPNMFFPFITGKNFAFRILVELLVGAYIMLALREPKYRPRMSGVMWGLVGFVGWMAIATILSVDPIKSFWSNFERMEGYLTLLHLFAYCVVVGAVVSAERWWNEIFRLSIALSVFESFYGLSQVMHWFGLSPSSQSGSRADGHFGNATYLAVYVLFNIFITCFMLVRERRSKSMQSLYGIALVLQAIALYLTGTRGALLGVIAGLVVAGVWVAWRARGAQWKNLRRVALGGLVAIVVVVAAFVAIRNTNFVKNSPGLSRIASISIQDDTIRARILYIWPEALQGFAERPVQGWGQENFNYVFNRFYNPQMYNQEQWFDRAHNAFIDWLVNGGLPAFVLYLSLFVLSAWAIIKSELSEPEQAAMLGLLVAYAVNNLAVFDNLVSYLYFFLIIAFAHGLTRVRTTKMAFMTRAASDQMVAVAAPVVLVLTLLAVWAINAPAIARARGLLDGIITVVPVKATNGTITGAPKDPASNLASFVSAYNGTSTWPGTPLGKQEVAEQMIQFGSTNIAPSQTIDPNLRGQYYTTAHDIMASVIAQRQHDARLELFMGTFAAAFGQSAEADKYLAMALSDSPKKQQILMEVGISKLNTADKAAALAPLKQAFEEATANDQARILYAAALIYSNQQPAADALIAQRYGSVVVDNAQLLQVYMDTKQYARAIAIWQLRIKNDPTSGQNHIGLASVYFTMGNKAQTIAELNAAAKLSPDLAARIAQLITGINNGTIKVQ
jgi:O-antigen ligase/thioredoxin-like negative regulator of GroEL